MKKAKQLTGKVTSDKMEKTVVVEVAVIYQHPLYQKRFTRTKKYYAHNAKDACLGDEVIIGQTRPLSKLKRWTVVKVKNTP